MRFKLCPTGSHPWTWSAAIGIFFWYILHLPYIYSRIYSKGVAYYLLRPSIHWRAIANQGVWTISTNQWVGVNSLLIYWQIESTGCTSRGYHNAAVNTTVILCNYQGDTVNNPGEMYDFVFTINFFGNSSSPNPSFISFYLQDAPPGGIMDSVEDVFLFSKPVILWPGQQLFGVPMMSSQRPQSDSGAALFSIPQVLPQRFFTWCFWLPL